MILGFVGPFSRPPPAVLTQLELLDVCGTQVTDAGLEHLRGLTRLKWLDLANTAVTDRGVERLQRALPGTGTLRNAGWPTGSSAAAAGAPRDLDLGR